jgi:hypothetical protein
MSKTDYLTELPHLSPAKWYTVTFFSKTHVKETVENINEYKKDEDKEKYEFQKDMLSFRICTGRATYEEAVEDCKKIKELDPHHHVFVAEGAKWCPFILTEEDSNKYVSQVEYDNEQLNEMMKKYTENQEKANVYHEYRKNQLVMKGISENLQTRLENKNETIDLLKKSSSKEERTQLKERLALIEDQIDKMEEKKKEISEKEKKLSEVLKLNKTSFE